MTALAIVAVVLAAVILVGNTLIAIAYLKSRGGFKSIQGRDQEAMRELHERVQSLRDKQR